ncbi:MAG: phosphoribosylformylglycinamidine synthase subunit PurQ, partial [Candidatus Zixiibacteriota bacterium]
CGLLPGALIRNTHLRFSCKQVRLRVESTGSPFTAVCGEGEILRMPIAHSEGNYYHYDREISELEQSGQVLFRYVDRTGNATPDANPNGSVGNIAGITNREGNVLGMMPHPERAVESILGSVDGLKILESVRTSLSSQKATQTV